MTKERYIGDGVYASLHPARMIMLRTNRVEKTEEAPPGFEGLKLGDTPIEVWDRHVVHWIALEPEVFQELLRFAWEIGWHNIVKNAHPPWRYFPSDEDYARDEEDAERKRATKEGFPEEE